MFRCVRVDHLARDRINWPKGGFFLVSESPTVLQAGYLVTLLCAVYKIVTQVTNKSSYSGYTIYCVSRLLDLSRYRDNQ
jgi:hypothetical protein